MGRFLNEIKQQKNTKAPWVHTDKTDLLDNYQVGQQVKVSINLRGREWTSPQGEIKYFNSIQGWRIELLQTEAVQTSDIPPVPPAEAFEPATDLNTEDQDDLPF